MDNGPQERHSGEAPRGDRAGFRRHLKPDLTAGFLVFLIALPLCLGIALACGFPPIAGIFTAVVGALVPTALSDSELTIKGPAAGLIVIVIGCVVDFGGDGAVGGFSAPDLDAYRAALAVGVVAGFLQVLFGLARAGVLGDFFPLSVVHGMLAAIGMIIMLKQLPVMLGVDASGEPLELLLDLPHLASQANPAITSIGVASLLLLFLWPTIGRRWSTLGRIPSPLAVLLVAIPLGFAFDLTRQRSFEFGGQPYALGPEYLVSLPERVFGLFDALTFPDFTALAEPRAWKWVFMFFVIGSIESLLSAKAVDLLDPWRRRTDLDRDMVAVGTGNLLVALIGGLPMISEIVRSKANIDNGARTRFANMWHGLFLLACVALVPMALHRIPLAALAAMLVYTGWGLARPAEFVHVRRIGPEQLAVFATTTLAVLVTDLLVGIAIGILVKLAIQLTFGVRVRSLFRPHLELEPDRPGARQLRARESVVFSNWIPLRRRLEQVGLNARRDVWLDLSATTLVDHSTLQKLHQLRAEFEQAGLALTIAGLEGHRAASSHPLAMRRRSERGR